MARQNAIRRAFGQSPVIDALNLAFRARQAPRTPVACMNRLQSVTARYPPSIIAAHLGCVRENVTLYEVRELRNPNIVNGWMCAFCGATIHHPRVSPVLK